MKMEMKNLGVFLFFFVLLEVMWCEGCGKEEREALLGLNSRFQFPFSWQWDGPDCCRWEGVECNSSIMRVAKLNLYDLSRNVKWYEMDQYRHWNLKYSDFIDFKYLKSLDLSQNMIAGCADNDGLENLEVLDLSYNNLDDDAAINCLDRLSSLKSLSLRFNSFNASSFQVFDTLSSKLPNLEVLDISANTHLTNDILPSLEGFTSLKELYLSWTGLDSDIHIKELCSTLLNLEVLDLSHNNFNGSNIGFALSGLSSLKSLNLGFCQLTPRSIFMLDISKLRSLEILDLSWNDLNEKILWRPENDGFIWPTNLQVLRLSWNSFTNKFLSTLSGLGYLNSLDLSYNQLKGSLNISGLSALTNLKILYLSYNEISNFVFHRGSKIPSRLDVLSLDFNMIDGKKLRKSLRALSSIRVLSMIYNTFQGKIVARDFQDLSNLEHLILDQSSNLENDFFESIGDLTSLKVLSVSVCGINGTLPNADWFKLTKLEELYLIDNDFEGPLPPSFVNMSSLRMLELSNNHFIGNFASNIASLTSLEYFGFVENQFEVPISFTPFANHSNLKFIYGEGNKVVMDSHPSLQTWIPKFQLQVLSLSSTTESNSLPFPNFLAYQYNLTSLDFTSCKLGGQFPTWLLENNTQLTKFFVRNCSFTGTFQLPSRPLLQIRSIDVSDNIIMGLLSNNISSIFPNLNFLIMSRNDIQGSIPHEFSQMNLLNTLDLSDNYLSGEIPMNIFGDRSQLKFLKLSNNKLNGPVFPILSTLKNLEQLYLDGNNLSGSIPNWFSGTSLLALDISYNHLVGKLPSMVGNLSNLVVLSLSNNQLEGSISTRFIEFESLLYLDISQNDFTGFVPSFANSGVRFIYMSNNRLSGLSKSTFNHSSLVMLDLSYNEITNNIQDMVLDLENSTLQILILKGNHFTGPLPKQLCQLTELVILDLSYNNFSGSIPNCLGKMPFDNTDSILLSVDGIFLTNDHARAHAVSMQFPNAKGKADFTTKKRSYTYKGDVLAYMSGIDLSYNKLNGNIPFELGNLTRIRALNLSHNDFIGKIPASFSNLVQTESLDLSFNKLSGQIPPQLSRLTFLAVFSVAHNNLSGETPERKGQFMTFDESSYEGNPFLCGPPLPKSCNPYGKTPAISPNTSYTGDSASLVDIFVFWITFGVSYTSVLLVIVVTLYINPYWRRTWFYHIELIYTNCYYFVEDNILLKFSNFRST